MALVEAFVDIDEVYFLSPDQEELFTEGGSKMFFAVTHKGEKVLVWRKIKFSSP